MFKFLKRNKKVNAETSMIATHAAILGEASRPISETEMIQELGINIHMIEDDKLNNFLEKISLVKGDDGKEEVDLNALALRFLSSKLIRASYVDPIDVAIEQLDVEVFVDCMELDMDEDDYEFGGTNLLHSIAKLIQNAYGDAKSGRKAKLLKVRSTAHEISVPDPNKKRLGIIS